MIKGANPQEWYSGSLCQVQHSKPARWWERMRELTVEKKAGEKQQLTNCGERSCGLPSNSHPLDLPIGRMSHKHAWRSGSLQHTKQSVLTTEVISLQANNPQLLYHSCFLQDASSPSWGTRNNRISPFLPEEAGLQQHSAWELPRSLGKALVLGSCSSFLLRWDLHHHVLFTLLTPVSLWVLPIHSAKDHCLS